MKYLNDYRIINLDHSQWSHVYPWPVRLAWAMWSLWLAIVAIASICLLRLKQTFQAYRELASYARLATRIIADDLGYRVGRAIIGEMRLCPA